MDQEVALRKLVVSDVHAYKAETDNNEHTGLEKLVLLTELVEKEKKKGEKHAIDTVFFTGDWIEGNDQNAPSIKNTQAALNKLRANEFAQFSDFSQTEQTYNNLRQLLDPSPEKVNYDEFLEVSKKVKEGYAFAFEQSLGPIYQAIGKEVKKIADQVKKAFYVNDNHSVMPLVDKYIKDQATNVFNLSTMNGAGVMGKKNKVFNFAGIGNINQSDMTWVQAKYIEKVGDIGIDYDKGWNIEDVKELQETRRQEITYFREQITQAIEQQEDPVKKQELALLANQQIENFQSMDNFYTSILSRENEVNQKNQDEFNRLGDLSEIDFLYCHKGKETHNGSVHSKEYGIGQPTKDYKGNMISGHIHNKEVQLNGKNIKEYLIGNDIVVEGDEELMEFNPGIDNCIILDYNNNGDVIGVHIYKYEYDELQEV